MNQTTVLLVLQYYIWQPHSGAGCTDNVDAVVVRGVPRQPIVIPLLEPGELGEKKRYIKLI